MFTTSLVAGVAAALLAPGTLAVAPTWQPDYRTALARSIEQRKPVAVFIARGADGRARLIGDGGLPADTARLLRQSYVCLFADTATPTGRELARAFGLAEGLVISDKTGGVQVLRHEGALSRSDLTGYLTRYTDTGAVAQTEFRGVSRPTAPVVAAVQPVYQPPVVFSPALTFQGFYGGG
jgi:hypothetical protein